MYVPIHEIILTFYVFDHCIQAKEANGHAPIFRPLQSMLHLEIRQISKLMVSENRERWGKTPIEKSTQNLSQQEQK